MENNKKEEIDNNIEDLDLSHFSEDDEGPLIAWYKKFGLFLFEVVKVVVISLAIIMPIRLFLVQPFYVEGASMEPNFYDKEYLVIDEISYRFNEPQRGQVIIFKNPKNTKVFFIKRIIGLPGERIEIKQGIVYINDQELKETYIDNLSTVSYSPITLEEDEYFVLGDNRTNSHDSRVLGPIHHDYFIGKVWIRGWPLNRINTFNLPEYIY